MSKKVLIAHVPYEHRGGEDVHVETLADAYSRIGVKAVFYPKSREPEKHSIVSAARSLGPSHVPMDFLKLWETEKPDFIHLHNAFPILGPAFFKWVIDSRAPLVMTVHNHRFFCTNGLALRDGKVCKDCFGSKLGWRPLLHNCNQSLAKSAYHSLAITEMSTQSLYKKAVRKFIAPSPYIESELLRYGIAKEKVTCIPNPIPFDPASTVRSSQRFDVLFAGRLSPEKGILQMLEIFRQHLPELKLGIVGSGPLEQQVKSMCAGWENLIFAGSKSRSEVLNLIADSKMGILPSICNEILPTFVLECLFQGKRCVVARSESVEWLTRDGFSAVSAPISDPVRFASAVREALSMPPISSEQLERLREFFSMDRFCSGLQKLVMELSA